MANPYGMTEFDVPGALSALEAARSNRIRQMLLQRQIAQEERAMEQQQGIRDAFQRYTEGSPGAGSASAASQPVPTLTPAAPEAAPAVPAPIDPAAGALAPAPMAAPEGDRQQLFRDLLAIDPQQAFQVSQAFAQMDEAQFNATTRRNGVLARAAQHLLSLPEDQRSAEFQRLAPVLMRDGGVTRQQLTGFELTPENLHFVVAQARDIEKLAEEARPQFRNVSAGDVLIDTNRIQPGGSARDAVVYESPFVRDAQGNVYERDTGGEVRGARNNNPGNIEDGPFARAQPGYQGSDGRFAIFETPEQGVRAQESLLRNRYLQRPTTVREVIERYSPRRSRGGDNTDEQVDNYIRYVENRLGIQPGATIDAARGAELGAAMREFETGQRRSAAPVHVRTIEEARELPPGTVFITPDGRRKVR